MYTGKNTAAIQSQQWLTEGLLGLVDQKRYDEITVGTICREADLSRQISKNMFVCQK